MKAIIPAAGLGTRFLPATKCSPKELLPVLDKPVIQYVVEEALAPQSVDGVIIVNSHDKPQLEEYFSEDHALEEMLASRGKTKEASRVHEASNLPVSFVYQDEPRGLGHAVLCAADSCKTQEHEPFFVLLGDYFVPEHDMCKRMAEVSRAHGGASVIAVAPVPEDQVNRYGIIGGTCIGRYENLKNTAQVTPANSDAASVFNAAPVDSDVTPARPDSLAEKDARLESCFDSQLDPHDESEGAIWKITHMVEKPKVEEAPSRLFIVGRYLLSYRIMELLQTQGPGAGNEIQLTDAMVRLLEEEPLYALVVDPAEGCDTGTPAAWAATNARLALRDELTRTAFAEALVGKESTALRRALTQEG